MTNVVKPRCGYGGWCPTHCSFGPVGGRAVRCETHIEPGMVNVFDVYARRCKGADGCPTQPTFGLELGVPTHCKLCRSDDMFNVVCKRCDYDDGKCKERALYGLEDSCPSRCREHKMPTMWDVVSKLCNYGGGCKNYPVYGLEQGRPTRCGEHNDDDMPDVKHKRCEEGRCTTYAFFGLPGGSPTFCFEHAKTNEGLVNVSSKHCFTCATAYSYNRAHEGRCFRCFIDEFPQSKLVRNYKTKEAATMLFLRNHFSALGMREDKRVPGGCSKYRPDLVLDLSDRVIISEVDENQHWCYEQTREFRRTMALKHDLNRGEGLADRPLVLIRFNPDGYSPLVGKRRVPSCWKHDPTTGLLGVRDAAAWQERLEVLRSSIAAHICAPIESLKEVHEVRLFYDGYSH